MQPVRFGCVLGVVGTSACLTLLAQELLVRSSADQIMVAAPKLHFLSGKPLERLRNGNAVAFDFHLAVLSEANNRSSGATSIASSSATISGKRNSRSRACAQSRSAASRLTADAAEAWCLDNIAVSSSGLPPRQAGLDQARYSRAGEPRLRSRWAKTKASACRV